MEFEQFGAYRIEALLGRGGMGEVYRAFDTEHDRVVALKVLSETLAADRGYRERFRREAHLAAGLNEPHIVPIHRYGEIDGRLFLDMRLVPGRDVAAVLAQEGPMTPQRAVSIISQTARALDSAHADGLVHRDVKPSNVLVTGEGDDEFVYLVDFGIARSTTDAQDPALPQTGASLGSFDYMAPERFLEKPVDKRVDVYALACVLFECLTGQRPFIGEGLATLMYAHVNTDPPVPSSVRPDLPEALDAVVLKGLAKDPDERYGTAGEFAAAVRTAMSASGVTPRPEVRARAAPPTSITPLPYIPPQTVGFSNPGQPTGYGPPSNPGQAAYAQGLSSYPQSGPSGPPFGPPPGPGGPGGPAGFGGSAPSGGRSRGLLPILLGVGALVAVGIVVLVVMLTGGNGSGRDDPPVTSAPTTEASTPSTEPSTGSATDEDTLLARIPAGFDPDNCRTNDPAGDGDLAAVDCGGAKNQPGPTASVLYLYPDSRMLDEVFLRDVQAESLNQLTDTDCPDALGYRFYNGADDRRAGRVACYIDPDTRNAVVVWTQDDADAEGIIIAKGGQDGLATLWTWWNDPVNSDFQS